MNKIDMVEKLIVMKKKALADSITLADQFRDIGDDGEVTKINRVIADHQLWLKGAEAQLLDTPPNVESYDDKARRVQRVEMFRIDSQPGDATRYRFLVRRDYSLFWFYSDEDTSIKYPTYLKLDEIKDIDTSMTDEESTKRIDAIATWNECNPWTIAECIRAVIAIRGGEPAEIA